MKLRYDVIDCHVVRPTTAGHEFLILRRPPGVFMGGAWGIIHGGIEAGETAWQAAARELREETGLPPIEFYQLDTVNTFYLAADDCIWHCPSFCAVVAPDAQVQLNEEHDAFQWIPRADIASHLLWPGERVALAELCREILDDGPARRHLRIALP